MPPARARHRPRKYARPAKINKRTLLLKNKLSLLVEPNMPPASMAAKYVQCPV